MTTLLLFFSCNSQINDTFEDFNSSIDPSEIDQLEAQEVFRIPERPWDLTQTNQGMILCSAQGGNKVYAWDPNNQERTELNPPIPDVQNIFSHQDGTLYFTQTDNGVTGSLSMLIDREITSIATQADDGTLMRWPMDFVLLPTSTANNLGWIVADYGAGLLFVIDLNGNVQVSPSGSNKPQSLLFVDTTLFIGGEDGIFKMDWPNGTPEQIDARSGLTLEKVNDKVWSGNSNVGIFEVEGPIIGLQQAARPGSLLSTSDGIYFADHVGEGIWLHTP